MGEILSAVVNEALDEVDVDLICGRCGQNLRGVTSDRCPECGRRFDRAITYEQLVPWEQRKHIGRWRGYWRTARWATFTPWKIAACAKLPVSRRSAMSFRAITVALGFVGWLAVAILWVRANQSALSSPLDQLLPNIPFASIAAGGLLVAMMICTGTIEYFARSRNLDPITQQRAGALWQYACAPLAIGPLIVVLANTAIWGFERLDLQFDSLQGEQPWAYWLLVTLPFIGWWVLSLVMLRQVARAGALRMVVAAVVLPLLWTIIAAVCVIVPEIIAILAVLFVHRAG